MSSCTYLQVLLPNAYCACCSHSAKVILFMNPENQDVCKVRLNTQIASVSGLSQVSNRTQYS